MHTCAYIDLHIHFHTYTDAYVCVPIHTYPYISCRHVHTCEYSTVRYIKFQYIHCTDIALHCITYRSRCADTEIPACVHTHTQSYPYRFAMTLLYPLFCSLSFLSFCAVWGLCRYNFQAEIIMGCFGVAKPAKAPRVGGSNDLMLRLVRRSTSSKMADWW